MKVTLFIPCIIDHFMPSAGHAMVNILKKCDIEVYVNKYQSCCGQPGYNMGFHEDARALAQKFFKQFRHDKSDYILVPSGSCAAMIKHAHPRLIPEKADEKIFSKIREFSEFFHAEKLSEKLKMSYKGGIFYHKSCHLLNEMEIDAAPKAILDSISGLKYFEAGLSENTCCGFGGSFSAAMPELSIDIGTSKLEFVRRLGLNTIIACDSGCLMHLKSIACARSFKMNFYHICEFIDMCSN